MFVLFDNVEGSTRRYKINGVYPIAPKNWTTYTQIGLEIDNAANAGQIVHTPDGDTLLLDALMCRSEAFTYDPATGDIIHNDTLVVAI